MLQKLFRHPKFIRSKLANTLLLRSFGLFKVPFLFFANPSIHALTDEKLVIRIPLNFLTRNHLKKRSMYFGVLAAGADCAAGFLAMREILHASQKIELVFSDFHAQFYQKAQTDIFFTCTQGNEILELVKKVQQQSERAFLPIKVIATDAHNVSVASFDLTLSLKAKS